MIAVFSKLLWKQLLSLKKAQYNGVLLQCPLGLIF